MMPAVTLAYITIAEALARLPGLHGEQSAELFRHGTLLVKVYSPKGTDPQTPHSRDEIYVVMHGSGLFFNGETHHPFGPGDFLFAPAGSVHRFEDFTEDFAVWVLWA